MVESYSLTNPTIISTKRVRRTLVDYLGLVGTLPPPGSMVVVMLNFLEYLHIVQNLA